MNAADLLFTWLELECVSLNDQQRLSRIPGDTCDDVEGLLVAKFRSNSRVYVRDDFPDDIAEMFRRLPPTKRFDSVFLEETLRSHGYVVWGVREEVTYYFAKAPEADAPDVTSLGDTDETLDTFAVLDKDGKILSRAWSVRRNPVAAEIALETVSSVRRKGYAKQVAALWVDAQLTARKVPIYSHRAGNVESKALAKALGAIPFVEVTSYQCYPKGGAS